MQNSNIVLTGDSLSFLEVDDYERANKIKKIKQNIYSKYLFNVNKAINKKEKKGMIKFNQFLRNTVLSCQESDLNSIEDIIKNMKQ